MVILLVLFLRSVERFVDGTTVQRRLSASLEEM
jgi:hypothetical protein